MKQYTEAERTELIAHAEAELSSESLTSMERGLAEIALASLTAEPFAVVTKNEGEVTVELLNGCADGEYDLFTAPPAPALRLPERVTAQDMRESLNIPMHEDEAQAAANGFNQALLEVSHLNAAAPQSVPVKLPQSYFCDRNSGSDEFMPLHDTMLVKSQVIAAIRAAGYQVAGEE